MTPDQIRDEVAQCEARGLSYTPLVFPEGYRPPKGFPRGELLCVNSKRERVYRINCKRLLAWLTKAEVA